ncbi:response regulator [Indioceanicola profundi]|uniref:response regulator n=1 Tax=Indioceanicola profundi TaxID=2220096 RepID=UPI000E6AE0D9|nr:response regulator [Indioceanicola profundi]
MNANLTATSSDPASILLVEDDPMDLDLMLCALEEAGFSGKVSVARSGREALEALLENPGTAAARLRPSVMFMDIHMPGASGLDVLERLRGNQRTRRLPVVMLTGVSDAGAIAACYSLGANACLVKPNEYRGLVRMMQTSARFWTGCNRSPPP